jgi:hypothetical protein
MSLQPLFLSILLACENQITNKDSGSSILVNNPEDCEEWGDCYGQCMEPYSNERTWIVQTDDFTTYLDENGQLSSEQCFAICTIYIDEESPWETVLEIESCVDNGTDENGDQSLTCGYLLAPYCEGRNHVAVHSNTQSAVDIPTWFLQATQAEIGSVGAFLLLREELQRLDAPQHFIQQCLEAARDEVQHARLMNNVCRSVGIQPSIPQISDIPNRSIFDIALENALEGCIHESYAAMQALHQSQHASTPEFRRLFFIIAQDELRHADLSLRIHQWLMTQLSQSQQQTIKEAQQKCLEQLLEFHANQPHNPALNMLGPPEPKKAQELAKSLFSQLQKEWHKQAS